MIWRCSPQVHGWESPWTRSIGAWAVAEAARRLPQRGDRHERNRFECGRQGERVGPVLKFSGIRKLGVDEVVVARMRVVGIRDAGKAMFIDAFAKPDCLQIACSCADLSVGFPGASSTSKQLPATHNIGTCAAWMS
jgi:hypothetical protein